MTITEPHASLDEQFSEPGASPPPWAEVREQLSRAEVYWLSTVRPDGHPHVTPLIAVWVDEAVHFCTGPEERKAKNLDLNRRCVLTTGCNSLSEGFDIVIEGHAAVVRDQAKLQRVAAAYLEKYGQAWAFTAVEGGLHHPEGGPDHKALAFEVTPTKVFGFSKGSPYSQTRYRFGS